MYFSAPLLLSFVATALAYSVTVPSGAQGWTSTGPQNLTWDRVSTDPKNFTVVLTSSDGAVNQILAAEVPGDLKTTSVNPPSGGWPQGDGFRLNLVQDVNHVNTILAQSSEYTIGETPSSASSSGSVSSTRPATAVNPTTPLTTSVRPLTTSTSSGPATSASPFPNTGYKTLATVPVGLVTIFAVAFPYFL